MQRRIADIKKDISAHSARSAWDKGVKGYAVEMFDDYWTDCTSPMIRSASERSQRPTC